MWVCLPRGRGKEAIKETKTDPGLCIFLTNDKKWHLWRAWGVGRRCPGDPDPPSLSSIHRATPSPRYQIVWCMQTHFLGTARETYLSKFRSHRCRPQSSQSSFQILAHSSLSVGRFVPLMDSAFLFVSLLVTQILTLHFRISLFCWAISQVFRFLLLLYSCVTYFPHLWLAPVRSQSLLPSLKVSVTGFLQTWLSPLPVRISWRESILKGLNIWK